MRKGNKRMDYHFSFSNNYLVKLLSALFIIVGSTYASLEYELIYGEKGPNKIKIFFFAEGYTDWLKESYEYDVQAIVDTLFTISPYKEYKNLFNVYRVWTPSHWSFIPGNESDSTFFGGYSGTGGPPKMSSRGLQYFTNIIYEQKDSNFLCDEFVWNQQSIVLYCNVGYNSNPGVAYTSYNLTLLYLGYGDGRCLAHELAHQIGRLGDEYERIGYMYMGPETANTTQKTTLDSIPWRYWVKSTTPVPTPETDEYYNSIGVFEGAQYSEKGWYRPSQSCIMQGSGSSLNFCDVCREYLTYSLLKQTHFTKDREFLSVMVDSVYPRMNTTVTNGKVMVTYAQIDTFPIKLSWRFNDSLLNDTSCILDLSAFRKNGIIKAIVEGNSGFIITPSYKPIDTIKWTFQYTSTPVKVSSVVASNNQIRQIRSGVYYIPQSAYGKFYITDMLGRNIPIRVKEKSADHMIVDLNNYAAKGKYMIISK